MLDMCAAIARRAYFGLLLHDWENGNMCKILHMLFGDSRTFKRTKDKILNGETIGARTLMRLLPKISEGNVREAVKILQADGTMAAILDDVQEEVDRIEAEAREAEIRAEREKRAAQQRRKEAEEKARQAREEERRRKEEEKAAKEEHERTAAEAARKAAEQQRQRAERQRKRAERQQQEKEQQEKKQRAAAEAARKARESTGKAKQEQKQYPGFDSRVAQLFESTSHVAAFREMVTSELGRKYIEKSEQFQIALDIINNLSNVSVKGIKDYIGGIFADRSGMGRRKTRKQKEKEDANFAAKEAWNRFSKSIARAYISLEEINKAIEMGGDLQDLPNIEDILSDVDKIHRFCNQLKNRIGAL
jgi:hypothetical protein